MSERKYDSCGTSVIGALIFGCFFGGGAFFYFAQSSPDDSFDRMAVGIEALGAGFMGLCLGVVFGAFALPEFLSWLVHRIRKK
jgi:hypothetical protein